MAKAKTIRACCPCLILWLAFPNTRKSILVVHENTFVRHIQHLLAADVAACFGAKSHAKLTTWSRNWTAWVARTWWITLISICLHDFFLFLVVSTRQLWASGKFRQILNCTYSCWASDFSHLQEGDAEVMFRLIMTLFCFGHYKGKYCVYMFYYYYYY